MLSTPLRAALSLVFNLVVLTANIVGLVVATGKAQIIISVLFVLLMTFFTILTIAALLDHNDTVRTATNWKRGK